MRWIAPTCVEAFPSLQVRCVLSSKRSTDHYLNLSAGESLLRFGGAIVRENVSEGGRSGVTRLPDTASVRCSTSAGTRSGGGAAFRAHCRKSQLARSPRHAQLAQLLRRANGIVRRGRDWRFRYFQRAPIGTRVRHTGPARQYGMLWAHPLGPAAESLAARSRRFAIGSERIRYQLRQHR